MDNPKLLVALIHNNDFRRLGVLSPKLKKFSESFDADFVEIFEQPEIRPVSLIQALKRELIYFCLELHFKKHVEIKVGPTSLALLNFFRSFRNKYLTTRCRRKNLLRRIHIERILTRKHLEAWYAADVKYDYLIVFEDDAVFLEDTVDRFGELRSVLEDSAGEEPLYVNLAGGFPLDVINASQFVVASSRTHVELRKPVTNTTCVYLLNRAAVRIFLQTMSRRPWYSDSNADWMTNGIILDIHKENIPLKCWHANPPIWRHGSMAGHFESAIRG